MEAAKKVILELVQVSHFEFQRAVITFEIEV